MATPRSLIAALLGLLALPACSGDTFENTPNAEDISGNYTVALTNGENTCMDVTAMDSNWMEGAETTGIPFTIHQDGAKIWADAEGASGIAFALLTGETRFQGDVRGSDFTLTLFGSKQETYMECPYKVNAVIEGTLEGDAINGTLTYAPMFDSDDACADYECQAVQAFNGSRPPRT